MKVKLTKKEKILYLTYGKKWDIIVKHYITISTHDTENILKIHDKMLDHCEYILKRVTIRIKIFDRFVYFNTVYGG